ncbi:MAG TPA: hypothetical protein VJ842_07360 [Pyrinomonadaceae bacterium]|nr:hypothetical protein [Pyrinomonadaceae bacterium]
MSNAQQPHNAGKKTLRSKQSDEPTSQRPALRFGQPNLNARQIAKSLLPYSDDPISLLLWPPNLFAFTGSILGLTGAYYLIVSPPRDENNDIRQTWPPKPDDKEIDDNEQEFLMYEWLYEWIENHKEAVNQEKGKNKDLNDWAYYVRTVGWEWRKRIGECEESYLEKILHPSGVEETGGESTIEDVIKDIVPAEVLKIWELFSSGFSPGMDGDIMDLRCNAEENKMRKAHWIFFVLLVTLHAIADEACSGWGKRKSIHIPGETKKTPAQKFAERQLSARGTLATINEHRCRVLPKRHTPIIGTTLRSLSSNLAFHRSSVDVVWRQSVNSPLIKKTNEGAKEDEKGEISSLQVLLFPWPFDVRATDFKSMKVLGESVVASHKSEAFFEYDPTSEDEEERGKIKNFRLLLRATIERAIKEAGRIDLVILPESSISEDYVKELEKVLKENNISGYIAGVRIKGAFQPVRNGKAKASKRRFNRNVVYCRMFDTKSWVPIAREEYRQDKHHRWRLTRTQVRQYQLGGSLSSKKDWWEGTKLVSRKVTFINIGENLTICPLICEDLARQEPIADLVRTVGPSLVITILMDGPQTSDRWPANYASVLADDPGCSVITLTSIGMVNRYQVPWREKSRAVAHWKEAQGIPTPIELDDDETGIILYLNVDVKKEKIADGREEQVGTSYLTLGGINHIKDSKGLRLKLMS